MTKPSKKNEEDFLAAKAFALAAPERLLNDKDVMLAFTKSVDTSLGRTNKIYDIRDIALKNIRKRLETLQEQHDGSIGLVHENFMAMRKIHVAIVEILRCRSLDSFIRTLNGSFADILSLDAVQMVAADSFARQKNIGPKDGFCILPKEEIADFQNGQNRKIGAEIRLRKINENKIPARIYGQKSAKLRSEGLLVLHNLKAKASPKILFAMGSSDEKQFDDRQNTDLLEFLRQVIAAALGQWIKIE